MRVLKLPDGRVRALVQGLQRVRVEYFTETRSSDHQPVVLTLSDG